MAGERDRAIPNYWVGAKNVDGNVGAVKGTMVV
jgi:hypothetical protein